MPLRVILSMLTPETMQKILAWLLNQGLAIALLLAAVWHFNGEVKGLHVEQKQLQGQLIEYLRNDRDTLKNQLHQNTTVLKSVEKYLENGKAK